MSANTSIKEGGKGRSFGHVKALMVQGSDGKYYPWYPESERQLDTLSVTKNGVYQAKKLGVYGWRSVSVNVPEQGSVTGKDPATGKEVTITADPETGELVTEPTPVEIRVTTPPTKITYTEGETISIAGAVITAYDSDGEELMTVPVGEITLEPDKAHAEGVIYTDDNGINAALLAFDTAYPYYNTGTTIMGTRLLGQGSGTQDGQKYHIMLGNQGISGAIYITKYTNERGNTDCYYLTESGSGSFTQWAVTDNDGWARSHSSNSWSLGNTDRWKVCGVYLREYFADCPVSTVQPNNQTALTSKAECAVTLSWQRPGDGAILETGMIVFVTVETEGES